jgi:membrane-bound lytic murein transglycosylase D
MLRAKICIILIFLLVGCSLRPTTQPTSSSGREPMKNGTSAAAVNVNQPSPSEKDPLPGKDPAVKISPVTPEKSESSKPAQQLPPAKEPPLKIVSLLPEKNEAIKVEQNVPPPPETSPKKTPVLSKKSETSKSYSKPVPTKPPIQEGMKESLEEAERDIMEEALILLNISHNYWVNGDFEDALEMLDHAYAILLDTNGNPDIARQKDDLRLMISKRILTIYNSIQANAKGMRSEIPIMTNADVEKEIRQFQTVERDFFISSYQRSALYRPMILKELKKAGLPEELSWLPLVESGFKINALSSARALGLWQFIPSTGYKYGLNRDDWVDERMDMEKSTRAAIDYMKELHTMFGDWLTVLAAYNCGEGRIIKTIASQHINYLDRFWDLYYKLPYETARYVPRFIATVMIIRDPQKYGMDLGNGKMPTLSYETVETNKSMRLPDIARRLDASEETLNILNAELRHRITPDKPYKLRVPTEMTGQLLTVIDEIPQADTPRETFRKKRGVAINHKVRQGETLASIAGKYKTSVGAIRSANHLSKKDQVVMGQRLTVPLPLQNSTGGSAKAQKSEAIVRHKVKKGDTLASLTRKYGISGSEIKKANHLESDKLKTGQTLRIEKGDAEQNREQKQDSHEDNKKGQVKVSTKGATEKTTATPVVKTYTVKKGDSLSKIARENNTTLDKLRQLNNLSNDNMHPGQVVKVK